jgi:hypothetical protein
MNDAAPHEVPQEKRPQRSPRQKGALLLALFAITVIATAFAWPFIQRDRPPEHEMVERACFICDRCKSAQGGIYGKGPMRHFRSSTAPRCVHNWKKVSRTEFKEFAARVFGHDWSTDISFWSREE